MSARDLDGAIVAVVGATGVLGSSIARDLSDHGARVVSVGRAGPDRTLDVVADLRDAGTGVAVRDHVVERHGRLDGLVIASGIVAFGDLVDTDDVVVEELFLTNVLGPLWLVRHLTPLLADAGGFVASISGVVAETPMPSMAAYSASKAALAAASSALTRELRRSGITVIDARPPHTETGLAGRPLAGTAPKMPTGLDPEAVSARIVQAIVDGEHEVPSSAFGG